MVARGLVVPAGSSWHRDLVTLCSAEGIVSENVANSFREYLAFRHFFSHGYAVELDSSRLQPLVEKAAQVFGAFKEDTQGPPADPAPEK